MTTFEKMDNNFVILTNQELTTIKGGSNLFSDIGGFINKTWQTLYNSGRDFGRSIINGIIR
ncbi:MULTISPECIES: alcohol dehydrogenase [Streptococcus]|uniref:ComC/BlpC family peptide pheromone/bacteriocin n=1 Tax=Streptococcus ruminantium TaxID=1917441 RepID=A0A2Z5TWG3_9STRE|nr:MULTISPECIES: alcohol dehydrogenase [Streptococcus]QHF53888.1 hypothetical protein BZG42_00025 [Streptococcus sp. DAT741]BBA91671.1 ComC/BlpC family peptide pheromone/bacteriocin [Streptococcus ruminantium]BDD37768.1 hypothetical protein GUT183_00060 [Streptococcus ruminantium]